MTNENPYAAPAEDPNPVYDVSSPAGEVWRAGKFLVMERHARLPARCIKCNTPIGVTMIARTLYYYPPWIALFILCNLIVLLIVAIVCRKKASVDLGMCGDCRIRRRNAIALAWSLVLAGIVCLIGGPIAASSLGMPGQDRFIGLAIVLAIFLILAGVVVGIVRGQLVVVRLINDRQIRLSGICREFVAQLPAGP